MDEKGINEKESIEIITSMIARTKQRYMLGDGNIMLMWGYLTIAVCILVWVLIALTHNPMVNWLWFLIGLIGGPLTPVMAKKRAVRKGAISYSDKIISGTWKVVGFTSIICALCCLCFQFAQEPKVWSAMFIIPLVIVPFAEMVQGMVIKENSLVGGGAMGMVVGIIIMCCISAGVPLFITWFNPLFIIAFIGMMIIPGYVINHKARRQSCVS